MVFDDLLFKFIINISDWIVEDIYGVAEVNRVLI